MKQGTKHTSRPLSLIINADDYGLHPSVDDAILQCYAAGVLSSASLMVNQPHWQAAANKAQAAGLPLGLHFNLTLGRPLSHPAQVPGLVDADGCFVPRRRLIARLLAGQTRFAEVRRELKAQCRAFEQAGLAMDHLDSHQHVHAHPRVLQTVAEYAQAQNVPLRFLQALPLVSSSVVVRLPLIKRLKQWLMAHQGQRQARRWQKNVRHNDFLVSVFDLMRPPMPEWRDYSSIFASLRQLREKPVSECVHEDCVVEWMVHPVADARAVAGLTRIGQVSQKEYEILLSPAFSRALQASGVRLMRFADIPPVG